MFKIVRWPKWDWMAVIWEWAWSVELNWTRIDQKTTEPIDIDIGNVDENQGRKWKLGQETERKGNRERRREREELGETHLPLRDMPARTNKIRQRQHMAAKLECEMKKNAEKVASEGKRREVKTNTSKKKLSQRMNANTRIAYKENWMSWKVCWTWSNYRYCFHLLFVHHSALYQFYCGRFVCSCVVRYLVWVCGLALSFGLLPLLLIIIFPWDVAQKLRIVYAKCGGVCIRTHRPIRHSNCVW